MKETGRIMTLMEDTSRIAAGSLVAVPPAAGDPGIDAGADASADAADPTADPAATERADSERAASEHGVCPRDPVERLARLFDPGAMVLLSPRDDSGFQSARAWSPARVPWRSPRIRRSRAARWVRRAAG